jgi:predicted SprT family Zn-dependent metalloprotease
MDEAGLAALNGRLGEEFARLNAERFGGELPPHMLRFSGRSVRTHGRINFGKREIMVSFPLYEQHGWEAVVNTLLHEMTHALVRQRGWRDGHSRRFWRELGERGGGRARYDVRPKKAYVYACPTCGREFERLRRLKRPWMYSCIRCDGRYNPRHRLYLKGGAVQARP